jgi:NADPH:quinone reductase-like Zn-dependent oxidoreductase
MASPLPTQPSRPIPSTSRAWTTSLDGISNLTLRSQPIPQLSATQILIHHRAISLNYKDAEIVSGLFTHHRSSKAPPNLIPCADSVGVIAAFPSDPCGELKGKWKVGDRVLSLSYPEYKTGHARPEYLAKGVGSARDGVLREWRVYEWDEVVRCPEYLEDEEACCLGIAGTTAWMGLRGFSPLLGKAAGREEEDRVVSELSGKTLLVQGTGGVSLIGVQLGKKHGMRVLVTSGSGEKLERAFADGRLGLRREDGDEGVNYREKKEWDQEVLRITDGEGADVIFENGGGNSIPGGLSSTTRSFRCVAFGGRINSIGYVAGKTDVFSGEDEQERMNVNVLALARNVTLKGLLNGPRDRFEEMLRFVEKYEIRPVVDKVFPFEESKEAMQYLWDGKHFGKVVIRVSGP